MKYMIYFGIVVIALIMTAAWFLDHPLAAAGFLSGVLLMIWGMEDMKKAKRKR